MFKIKNFIKKIEEAKNILVVCSRPIDEDCLGTSLNISYLLRTHFNKDIRHVSFHSIPSKFDDFPLINTIDVVKDSVDNLAQFDLIILTDGSDWGQFFGTEYKNLIETIDLNNIFLIDHHKPGNIHFDLKDNCLFDTSASSAAEVLYFNVFKSLNFVPDQLHAELLYMALISDTLRFEHSTTSKAYNFASELLCLGVNHLKVVDEQYDKKSIQFMAWGINNLEYYDDLNLTILRINKAKDEELEKLFKHNWFMLSIHKAFINLVVKKIKGYDYHLMFRYDARRGGIDAGWRTRNYGEHIAIIDVLRSVGFHGGGHFGAGGAFLQGEDDVDKVVGLFVEEMRKVLLSVSS